MKNATHTHTAKIVSALAGLSISASLALAERSGAFVGVEVGYGESQYQVKHYELERNVKLNSDGVYYGLVAGYKHFFTPYLGLRSYVNFDVLQTKFNGQASSMRANLFTYGVNVDFLGNFLSTSVVDFGGFVGLWLGGNTWQGKDIDSLIDAGKQFANLVKPLPNASVKTHFGKSAFDVAINLGLRTNIAKYHGIELAGRVPFLPTQIVSVKGSAGDANQVENFEVEAILKHTWNLTARYTFSF